MQTQNWKWKSLQLYRLWTLLHSYERIFQRKVYLQKGMMSFLHPKYFKPDMRFYARSKGIVIVVICKEKFMLLYLSG